MEYHPNDLTNIIYKTDLCKNMKQVKIFIQMILNGMNYLHSHFFIHRDLKPANILVSNENVLKITDFGSVRPFGNINDHFTQGVCTPNYRAPEIWFGAYIYGPASDIWSIGCIFFEMIKQKILFKGDEDRTIVNSMYNILGSPNSDQRTKWEGVEKLEKFSSYKPYQQLIGEKISSYLFNLDEQGKKLIDKMLIYNPRKRISCDLALNHPYFDDLKNDQMDLD